VGGGRIPSVSVGKWEPADGLSSVVTEERRAGMTFSSQMSRARS